MAVILIYGGHLSYQEYDIQPILQCLIFKFLIVFSHRKVENKFSIYKLYIATIFIFLKNFRTTERHRNAYDFGDIPQIPDPPAKCLMYLKNFVLLYINLLT